MGGQNSNKFLILKIHIIKRIFNENRNAIVMEKQMSF